MGKRCVLEKLKLDWMEEPNWPIEDTEGFEVHYDELLAFRREHEIRMEEHCEMLDHLCDELDVKNMKLVRYLAKMEYRLSVLEMSMQDAPVSPVH